MFQIIFLLPIKKHNYQIRTAMKTAKRSKTSKLPKHATDWRVGQSMTNLLAFCRLMSASYLLSTRLPY